MRLILLFFLTNAATHTSTWWCRSPQRKITTTKKACREKMKGEQRRRERTTTRRDNCTQVHHSMWIVPSVGAAIHTHTHTHNKENNHNERRCRFPLFVKQKKTLTTHNMPQRRTHKSNSSRITPEVPRRTHIERHRTTTQQTQ